MKAKVAKYKTGSELHHTIYEHDIVALNEDLPDSNLIKDDKGAIVHVYKNNAAYEVEFPREGTAPIVITLQSFQIRKIKGGTNG